MTDEGLERLLLDAMNEERCPICGTLESLLFDEMCALQGLTPNNEPAAADSVPYCSEHLWYLQDLSSSNTGAARLAPLVERASTRLGDAAARSQGEFIRGDALQIAATLGFAPSCHVCAWGARIEGIALRTFLGVLSVPANRERYARTPGVCLPHLSRILEIAEDREFSTWLLCEAARQLAWLGRKLREFALRGTGLLESDALPRAAAEALVGARRRASPLWMR